MALRIDLAGRRSWKSSATRKDSSTGQVASVPVLGCLGRTRWAK